MRMNLLFLITFLCAQKLGKIIMKTALKLEAGLSLEMATSKAARREAMRRAGIPTSKTPNQVTKNASGKQYQYVLEVKGGGSALYSVQQQTLDSSHPGQRHWEAGKVKVDDSGNPSINPWLAPRLDNSKSKVNFP